MFIIGKKYFAKINRLYAVNASSIFVFAVARVKEELSNAIERLLLVEQQQQYQYN